MILKFRYYLRLLTAFIARFKGLILLGAIFGVVSFFGVRLLDDYVFAREEERIAVTGRYHAENLPNFITKQISEGLTSINDSYHVEPSLATSWETPDDGKTWIFNLREEAVWQDEDPVSSESIVYEFSDVSIEKPDRKTIVFQLEESFAPFPSVVSKPAFKQGLLGTGAWKVEDIKIANGFVQELKIINDKKARIYKFYPTEENSKLAFKLGEVDKVVNIMDPEPMNEWEVVESNRKINKDAIVTLFFNTKDPILADKSVRQSLLYAINNQELPGERSISPISPDSWAHNPLVKKYDHDLERAKSLIEDLPSEIIEDEEIRLATTPALLPTAESIASYWEKLGFNVQLQVTSVVPSEFQVLLTIFDSPKDPDQYPFWHSTQTSTNISNYQNPRIDKLLEDGRLELDQEERRQIYLNFQRFLVEDSPAGFLYHPYYYDISRK